MPQKGPRGGRPSFDIPPRPPSILEELRGLGFTWTCIAKMLNVSRSTINRRVADHGLQDASKVSEITDAELDHLTTRLHFSTWTYHRSILPYWVN